MNKIYRPLIIGSLLVMFITGCATNPIVVSAPLECPVPLVLPKVSEELKPKIVSMDEDLYTYFVTRDRLQSARRETLQAICRSTHE